MDTVNEKENKAVTAIPEGCDDFDVDTLHAGASSAVRGVGLTFPLPLVVLFLITTFLAGAYFMTLGGSSKTSAVVEERILTPFELGEKVYKSNCQACHGANGAGGPGYPPLVDSEYVVKGNKQPIGILLYGLAGPITVKGVEYNGAMPAWGGSLDDEQIANVLTYIRASWGNKATAVSAEQVAAVRAEYGAHAIWTAEDLSKIPQDEDVSGAGGDSASVFSLDLNQGLATIK